MVRRPRIPKFDPDRLESPAWLDLFSMNCAISEVTEETAKRALLLSSVGVDKFATICKLTAPELPSAVPFDDLVSQFKSHFITKPIVIIGQYVIFSKERKRVVSQ